MGSQRVVYDWSNWEHSKNWQNKRLVPLHQVFPCGSAAIWNPPAMWETWVQSLGWDDPLEKGKATHSCVLAWRTPWTGWSMESQRVGHDWVTFTFTFLCIKGQYLCFIIFIYFIFWLRWVFTAAHRLSLGAASRVHALVVVHGFLVTVGPLTVKHRL